MFLKKICCAVLSVIAACSFCACGKAEEEQDAGETADTKQVLCGKGLEVTVLLGEMAANEDYTTWLGLTDNLREILDTYYVAYDYDTPTAVYEIGQADWQKVYEKADSGALEEFMKIPENVREQAELLLGSHLAIFNYFTSQYGTQTIAISNALFATKRFSVSLSYDTVYLYVFETGVPIFVTFDRAGAGEIKAVGRFVRSEAFTTLSATREAFQQYGCKVEKIR